MPHDATTTDDTTWRELAVSRSLDLARARAEKRVQRFLDAGLELLSSSDTHDFTVQEVVDRSGQSLRAFYQYFEGKSELLLALFEESVAQTAEQLGEAVESVDDPLERLRLVVAEYYRRCTPARTGAKGAEDRSPNPLALAGFAQQLLTEHPKEAGKAFVPLVTLFVQIIDDAADAGVVREGLDHRRVAGVLLQAIMFNAFAATISGSSLRDGEEAVLDLLINGLVVE